MTTSDQARQTWARIAGLFFLVVMATFMIGELGAAAIRGSGEFAEVAQRVLGEEHLYRAALTSIAIGALSIVVLAHALYVVLQPVSWQIAQLALWARLGEAFIVGALLVLPFASLDVYAEAGTAGALADDQLQVLRSLVGSGYGAGFLIWMLFFSLGSTLFFYLFYTSRLIPRALAGLGILGSVLQVPMSLGSLIFPEHAASLRYLWAPIFLAEVGTGLWLLVKALPDPLSATQREQPHVDLRS